MIHHRQGFEQTRHVTGWQHDMVVCSGSPASTLTIIIWYTLYEDIDVGVRAIRFLYSCFVLRGFHEGNVIWISWKRCGVWLNVGKEFEGYWKYSLLNAFRSMVCSRIRQKKTFNSTFNSNSKTYGRNLIMA